MNTILLGMIGPWQIALIAVIVLLLFGGKKIPQLMKGIGSGISEFKKGVKEGKDEEGKDEEKEKEPEKLK
jgi:sec-independent protein translocase protein TatA